MILAFFRAGNLLFTKENVPIPREGEFVVYAGKQYKVLAVVHDYVVNNVKIYVT